MEQIVKQYGIFILEGMVYVLLLGLFFTGMKDKNGNIGFFNLVGSNLEIEKVNYEDYKEFRGLFCEESKKTAPLIKYIGKNLKTGINKIDDNISASNYSGAMLPIHVISIKNPLGEELIGTYQKDTSQVYFELSGIYTIVVSARDDGNRYSEAMIRFPVNKTL